MDAGAIQAQETSSREDVVAAAGTHFAWGCEFEVVETDSVGMAWVVYWTGIAGEVHCGKHQGRFGTVVDRFGSEIEADHSGKEG